MLECLLLGMDKNSKTTLVEYKINFKEMQQICKIVGAKLDKEKLLDKVVSIKDSKVLEEIGKILLFKIDPGNCLWFIDCLETIEGEGFNKGKYKIYFKHPKRTLPQ